MRSLPALPEAAFVQAGDCIGIALRRAAQRGLPRAHLFAMVGKLAKVAAGMMQTHASKGEVDTGLLAGIAGDVGASERLRREIAETHTARHALERVEAAGLTGFGDLLC